ncbi:MAG TPA: H-type lectin domain-containing protein [Streptomyces sp.]|nr:H-type lectin domain-containing protein [Streptomyces sp.]
MSTTDDYGQGVDIATLTDAPNAESLARNIANALAARSVMRFASATERAATLVGPAAPVEGMVTYLKDADRLESYNGTAWRLVSPLTQQGTKLLSWSGQSAVTSLVTFPYPFPSPPQVFVNIATGDGAVARWSLRAISIGAGSFQAFLYAPDPDQVSTATDIPVQWLATLA